MSLLNRLQYQVSHLKSTGLRGQLLRGGMGSVAIKVSNLALMLGISILLARAAGAAGYGVYAYAYAIVQVLAIPAQLGFQVLVVREVAAYQAKEEYGFLNGILRRGAHLVSLVSVGIALSGFLVIWFLAERFTDQQLMTIGFGLLLLPMIALGNFRGAAIRGFRNVVQGQLPELILRPGFFVLLLAIILWQQSDFTIAPDQAMALHVAAGVLAFVFGSFLLLRNTPGKVRTAIPEYDSKRWLRSSAALTLIGGMQVINSQTDIIMLGFFTGAEELGIYRVAMQGSILVAFGLQAVNMIVAPHFSRLYARSELVQLQHLVTASSRIAFTLAFVALCIFMVWGGALLAIVFGPEYVAGSTVLVILGVGQLINAAMGSVVILLNMTGREKFVARGLGVAAVGNISMNLLLIPMYGIVGAALSTMLTFLVWNVFLWRLVRSELGIRSSAFGI